jgi:hypothetical protein
VFLLCWRLRRAALARKRHDSLSLALIVAVAAAVRPVSLAATSCDVAARTNVSQQRAVPQRTDHKIDM